MNRKHPQQVDTPRAPRKAKPLCKDHPDYRAAVYPSRACAQCWRAFFASPSCCNTACKATFRSVCSAARKVFGTDAVVSGYHTFEGYELDVSSDGLQKLEVHVVGRTPPEAYAMALAALRVRAGETS